MEKANSGGHEFGLGHRLGLGLGLGLDTDSTTSSEVCRKDRHRVAVGDLSRCIAEAVNHQEGAWIPS